MDGSIRIYTLLDEVFGTLTCIHTHKHTHQWHPQPSEMPLETKQELTRLNRWFQHSANFALRLKNRNNHLHTHTHTNIHTSPYVYTTYRRSPSHKVNTFAKTRQSHW